MALTENQGEIAGLQNKNWIRRIVRVNRADKRRVNELGAEVGVKERIKKKLVRSRLK